MSDGRPLTRRRLLRRAGAASATLLLPGWPGALAAAGAPALRAPNSLPHPALAPGTADSAMPFDHIVVVMMENHSFDNVLGGLARAGSPQADGLSFDATGTPTNANPGAGGPVRAFALSSTTQGRHVSQSWNATHHQIDGGRMDGFVSSVNAAQPMGYYPPRVLPFAYSLASTFTVANRWFSSAPAATYPNRRFLLAATAYGNVSTTSLSLRDPPPPNGTIFDRLHAHGISWRNYYTDLPQTAIIPSIVRRYAGNLAPIARFLRDCRAGTLPAVSFVDPEFGLLSDMGGPLSVLPQIPGIGTALSSLGGDEEAPQDMYYGEAWAHSVVEAVLRSPAWPRTLLIYLYDEHGGYYDHVAPPAAIAPDAIAPRLAATDAPGGYDTYGPRVPAVVASPHSRPAGVTNVVHDHTSILATIEAKWNLPALTYRDANAATVMDFLDLSRPALLTAPSLRGPSLSGPSGPVL